MNRGQLPADEELSRALKSSTCEASTPRFNVEMVQASGECEEPARKFSARNETLMVGTDTR
jgi:hypothetical protein